MKHWTVLVVSHYFPACFKGEATVSLLDLTIAVLVTAQPRPWQMKCRLACLQTTSLNTVVYTLPLECHITLTLRCMYVYSLPWQALSQHKACQGRLVGTIHCSSQKIIFLHTNWYKNSICINVMWYYVCYNISSQSLVCSPDPVISHLSL